MAPQNGVRNGNSYRDLSPLGIKRQREEDSTTKIEVEVEDDVEELALRRRTSVGRRGKDLHFWMVEGEVMGRRGMGGKEDAMVQGGGRFDVHLFRRE